VKKPLRLSLNPQNLRPLKALRLERVRPKLRSSLKYPRLLLSSTPSGPTPSNKLDGLNKELPTPRTSLTKLPFTRMLRLESPDPSNGESSNTRVD
jgi:hypothetical protein